jgi:hypothetical protein
MKRFITISIITLLSILIVGFIGFAVWGSFPLQAEAERLALAYKTDNVSIENTYSYFKITPNTNNIDTAIIYYPGARVQPEAYLYKLSHISQQTGWQIYITKPLFNFAIFGINDADKIINQESKIQNWYLAGHSLGGAMACQYIANTNQNNIKGIILFGSYCSSDISKRSYQVLSISGANDGLSTPDKIKLNQKNLPLLSSVKYIDGMNHAQNGNYGKQDGDQEATISDAEALAKIVLEITKFATNN